MKTIFIQPGEKAVIKDFKDFEEIRDTIGGYVESIRISPDVMVLCDEDGTLKYLPFSCTLFFHNMSIDLCGNVIIVGCNHGEFCDLSPTFIEKWEKSQDDMVGAMYRIDM